MESGCARGLRFSATNESLPAIIEGLRLSSEDQVLAICGSGDQAFAMIEMSGSVTAVDINISQMHYAQKRARALQLGDIDQFLRPSETRRFVDQESAIKERNTYFLNPKRLDSIRQKLVDLSFTTGEIISATKNLAAYTALYFSNIFDVTWQKPNGFKDTDLEGVFSTLQEGSLMYTVFRHASPNGFLDNQIVRKYLTVDNDLTTRAKKYARRIKKCDPVVLRKKVA